MDAMPHAPSLETVPTLNTRAVLAPVHAELFLSCRVLGFEYFTNVPFPCGIIQENSSRILHASFVPRLESVMLAITAVCYWSCQNAAIDTLLAIFDVADLAVGVTIDSRRESPDDVSRS